MLLVNVSGTRTLEQFTPVTAPPPPVLFVMVLNENSCSSGIAIETICTPPYALAGLVDLPFRTIILLTNEYWHVTIRTPPPPLPVTMARWRRSVEDPLHSMPMPSSRPVAPFTVSPTIVTFAAFVTVRAVRSIPLGCIVALSARTVTVTLSIKICPEYVPRPTLMTFRVPFTCTRPSANVLHGCVRVQVPLPSPEGER